MTDRGIGKLLGVGYSIDYIANYGQCSHKQVERVKQKNQMQFLTSEGETKTGEALQKALATVAQDKRELARDVRKNAPYAQHVTEQTKDDILKSDLRQADEIEAGMCNLSHFWLWQKVNMFFTGECVARWENKKE